MSRAPGPHPLPVFLNTVTQATTGNLERLAEVLAGVRRYQAAERAPSRPPKPEVARIGSTVLRAYADQGRPVVVVPSLINPPTVLDLTPGNSLLDYLAEAGLRPLLVDWGTPGEAERDFDLGDHVTRRLLPLIVGLGEPVALAGYCLGGTLAVAAAQLAETRVTRLALLAAPWRFAGYDDDARAAMASWWNRVEPLAAPLGVLPMDMLQPLFWSLDPQALAAKYQRLAALPADADISSFVALEDWANDGPPLTLPAARELVALYADDATGRGDWSIGGRIIEPASLRLPLLDIVAGNDRIVPPAAALSVGRIGESLTLAAGHVGMVVGSRARGLLWERLARWLGGA